MYIYIYIYIGISTIRIRCISTQGARPAVRRRTGARRSSPPGQYDIRLYTMLQCNAMYYAMLCYTILYYTIPYYTILYYNLTQSNSIVWCSNLGPRVLGMEVLGLPAQVRLQAACQISRRAGTQLLLFKSTRLSSTPPQSGMQGCPPHPLACESRAAHPLFAPPGGGAVGTGGCNIFPHHLLMSRQRNTQTINVSLSLYALYIYVRLNVIWYTCSPP